MTNPDVLLHMLLQDIREGMAVFDKHIHNVGTVMAAEGQADEATAPWLREGFIPISTGGFFPITYLAMPEQVSDVDPQANRVYLYVEQSELLRPAS